MNIDIEKAYNTIVMGTAKFFKERGFEKAVIGLSGGIDSAVTSSLVTVALGPENVIGVAMPSHFSSEESYEDAKQLVDNLGIDFKYIPINKPHQAMLKNLADSLDIDIAEIEGTVVDENIQARLRMVQLMALCNKYHALLIDTGNSTEYYLGYATLYGDLAGSIAPIVGLNKTEVYEMGRHINNVALELQPGKEIIPERIFKKKPSAELCDGQTDPFDYTVYSVMVDEIVLEGAVTADMKKRYDEDDLERARSLIEKSLFKRLQSPPGIELKKELGAENKDKLRVIG